MIDYIGIPCPVCGEKFREGDDIVVCPICGTPSHRECYQKTGRCVNEEKHKEGYVFQSATREEPKKEPQNDTGRVKPCPRCGSRNYNDALFCDKCGFPLSSNSAPPTGYPYGVPGSNQQSQGQNNMPNMPGPMPGMFILDPMGGVNPEEDFDGVKAGNLAKFVGNNPPYYMMVFKRLKDFRIGKFNFCAFLFSGGWMLYRKQYLWGSLIAALMIVLMLGSTLISLFFSAPILDQVISAAGLSNSTSLFFTPDESSRLMQQILQLPVSQQLIVYLPSVMTFLSWGVMFFTGFRGNRMYYKHCLKTVKAIQEEHPADPGLTDSLKEKGGINWALGICILVCFMIISYFPMFL